MKSNKMMLTILLLVCVVVGVGYSFIFWRRVQQYQNQVEMITYMREDASGIPDGKYYGECDVDFISAKVSVIVRNEQMREITVMEYHHDRGYRAVEVINNILDDQMIDVDTISGATNSSNVIKKAVDDALMKTDENLQAQELVMSDSYN